ncbi:multidrug efflux pump [Herbaspirillum sp. Sphag1AN]|uniref:efflux RND transporter permease subunit n=1 Tax=unclassified Herbaspirillum TaxID=2624150 RepID=UPI001618C3E4|nr:MULTISPECIES: efflux RND transporter permease subunit [unclassified Herbaspirillum]MBB3213870.1 multidrug efflux pump [Herbaspirillum sp. Sphag1AN]MBB3247067.1 multidrug efflux pump [Herbaspirillum sp. Sphag64]
MARFFIDRPIFAWVIAIIVMLAGIVAIKTLPIAQYPTIAQPTIAISANYPGASAKTLEDTVTQIIEQKMKGLDRLSYMSSTSDSSGAVTITLTFENGTDPDTAQVQVQNKLSLATPLLPQEVQNQGVQVTKSSNNFLVVVAFVSTDGSMSDADLSDYVGGNIQDQLSRVSGVGDTTLFGAQYSMRIWLDPNKLTKYKFTPLDISTAVSAQNAQISAGQLGALPAAPNQQINATITAQTRLRTAEQFGDIVLRTQTDGSTVKLKDVARIELGSESYNSLSRYNGKPAAGLAIKLATGANALDTVKAINAKLDELSKFYPQGMKAEVPYDTTPFVRLSIEDVIKTLVEAVVLVFLVMYLFLQNFRATLIPTIAVPVVLLGTFGVLYAFGYSMNTLTMFAMVLAIGLLVDDAIVVVENVERVMSEEGLSPVEATRKSMGQITGALVGVALVLAAVFVPMAFFGGSVGVIYRQFSITIVSAMALSVLTAMILTPALCATLLKPVSKDHQIRTGFFGWFNRNFDRGNVGYQGAVGHILGRSKRYMLIYAVLAALVVMVYMKIPGGFLPDEDQGIVYAMVQLPPGATQNRTLKVLEQVENHFLVDQKDAVSSIFTVSGFSFAGNGQNMGIAFVKLRPWDERKTPELQSTGVIAKAGQAFAKIRDANVFAFAPPAVSELGNASGFDMELVDNANLGHDALMKARNQLLGLAMKEPGLVAVRPNGQDDSPQFQLDIDQAKATALGLSLSDINQTFSIAWGSSYVNDFIDKGRVKKVYLQADAPFRMLPSDIDKWYVSNSAGTMVPFSTFAKAYWTSGSPRLERYNGLPSVEILGMDMPGKSSSGEALATMERLAATLPPGIGYEWTGISKQEKQAGSQAMMLYAVSILIVFLCLAALYESWSIPVSVLLVVPLGVLGTLAGAVLTWKMNDVYFQVGLLTTVGLSAKNAILIIEFAKELYAHGKSASEAAIEAARLRLRPILMTSLAFTLGVLPMVIGTGAGSGAQHALGTAVIGGMISATVLAIFFVPLFFVVVMRLTARPRQAAIAHPSIEGE